VALVNVLQVFQRVHGFQALENSAQDVQNHV
jgi:hypothetical protein